MRLVDLVISQIVTLKLRIAKNVVHMSKCHYLCKSHLNKAECAWKDAKGQQTHTG